MGNSIYVTSVINPDIGPFECLTCQYNIVENNGLVDEVISKENKENLIVYHEYENDNMKIMKK